MMKHRGETGLTPEQQPHTQKEKSVERISVGPVDDALEVEIHAGIGVDVPSADELDFSIFGAKAGSVSVLYKVAYGVARMPFVIDHIKYHAERRAWEARLEARGGYEQDLARTRNNKLSVNKLGQAIQAIAGIKMHAGKLEDKTLQEEIEKVLRRELDTAQLIGEVQNMEQKTLDEKINLAKDVEEKVVECLNVIARHLPKKPLPNSTE